jgi:S1-C subfamily serine protease
VFISADGDVLTAAHVALDRRFSAPVPGQIRIDVDYKPGLRIGSPDDRQPPATPLPRISEVDIQRAMSDLAILRTGIATSCFLKVSDKVSRPPVGSHVIAIGYPMTAPTGALYDGFISAEYRHLPIPIAVVENMPIFPNYDVMRVQMPITPGASGGPVIADDDTVVGIVVENPTVWFTDLNSLIEWGQTTNGGFNAPVSDLPKLVAKLAWVVQEFVTSGAGLAVPVSYLKVQGTKAETPVKPTASTPEPPPHHGWFQSLIDHLKGQPQTQKLH